MITTSWAPVILGLAVLSACNRAERARHEGLARALRAPVERLCDSRHNAEAGGCYKDCWTRLHATEGRAAVEAGTGLAQLATIDDPETEKQLVNVRALGREVSDALARACPARFEKESPVTPELTRCADARQKNAASVSRLDAAVTELAKQTKTRTGVELPNTTESCVPD